MATAATSAPPAASPCCGSTSSAAMDPDAVEAIARRLKALADPTRLRLLELINAHEGHEACVCDLTDPVGLSQPTVSHHLKILVDAGFLTRSKRGTWAYYRLIPGSVASAIGSIPGA